MTRSLEIAWLNEGELEQALWLAMATAHDQAPIQQLPLPQVHITVCRSCSQHPDLQNSHPRSVTHRAAVLSTISLVSVGEAAGVCTGLTALFVLRAAYSSTRQSLCKIRDNKDRRDTLIGTEQGCSPPLPLSSRQTPICHATCPGNWSLVWRSADRSALPPAVAFGAYDNSAKGALRGGRPLLALPALSSLSGPVTSVACTSHCQVAHLMHSSSM